MQRWVQSLNAAYRREPALYEADFSQEGFEWIDACDADASVISFLRKGRITGDVIMVAANFTPVPRIGYRLGVPRGGFWSEILNSDAKLYGGSGHGNFGGMEADAIRSHGRPYSLRLVLPPLGVVFLKSEAPKEIKPAVGDLQESPSAIIDPAVSLREVAAKDEPKEKKAGSKTNLLPVKPSGVSG
jgi:1,4-alpha-glucan branching enzyme